MTETKRALITGVAGQDGSYLAELLVGKGYEVHGIVRRHAVQWFPNIQHLLDAGTLRLWEADLTDLPSLEEVVTSVRPHEVYNLAAMSHVGTSFTQPEVTMEVTGQGALRVFQAVRMHAHDARVYQASSSEMFGNRLAGWGDGLKLDEAHPFNPVSPYGAAKVYAHHAAQTYRTAHGMHIACGILFNHECVVADTPIIVRQPSGLVDLLPIAEVMPNERHVRQRPLNLEVWDKDGFTTATLGTVSWNAPGPNDKQVHRVTARCGELRATADHNFLTADGVAVPSGSLEPGVSLQRTALPEPPCKTVVTPDLAYFLGLMAAEGYAGPSEGDFGASFRNNDVKLLDGVAGLWERMFGYGVRDNPGVSGFTGAPTGGLALRGDQGILHWLSDIMYTKGRSKRVPKIILNADVEAWRHFLRGYNDGDGLKSGHGKYEFKNFKSSSPTLTAGLWWLADKALGQRLTLNTDFVRREDRDYAYYSINLNSPQVTAKGAHLKKPSGEVKSVRLEPHSGWLYDLATESGTFHAGIGDIVIHNSPRRGAQFVTRKVTLGLARIKAGKAKALYLGNLDAVRDWGYAPEYMEGAWRMLQQDQPGDLVLATGEGHTVAEWVAAAGAAAGFTLAELGAVVQSVPEQKRPTDIHRLVGNAAEAKATLGWEPKVKFYDLVQRMVQHDLDLVAKGAA